MIDQQETVEPKDRPDTPRHPWENYRLSAQVDALVAEGQSLAALPYLPSSSYGDNDEQDPKTSKSGGKNWFLRLGLIRPEAIVLSLSVLGVVANAVMFALDHGIPSLGLYTVLALIPLMLVIGLLIWADRYAPSALKHHLLALTWGAGVATLFAGHLNSALFDDFTSIFGDVTYAQTLAAVAVAPLTEEGLKGAGVIIILLLAGRRVVSATNGAIIGGLVGGGFAFIENIQYFALAHSESTAVLGITVFARGVLSPFVHPMATSFIGLGFAAAMLRQGSIWSWIWRISLGFLGAIAVHALWNGFASLGMWWLVLYLLIEVPLFISWLIWLLRRAHKQAGVIGAGLRPYLATGWISNDEVQMVIDPLARRHARKWARKVGHTARRAISTYLASAGRLGLIQHHLELNGSNVESQRLAHGQLESMLAARSTYTQQGQVFAAAARRPPPMPLFNTAVRKKK